MQDALGELGSELRVPIARKGARLLRLAEFPGKHFIQFRKQPAHDFSYRREFHDLDGCGAEYEAAERGLIREVDLERARIQVSQRAREVRLVDDGLRQRTFQLPDESLERKEHLCEAYAAIQPNMVVPALVHDGALHVESMEIIDYLDHAWPVNPLTPRDPEAAQLCEQLVELGKALHVSVRFVSFRWGLKGLGKIGTEHEATLRRLEREGSPEQLVEFYSHFNRDSIDAATCLGHLRALEAGWSAQDARLAADGRPFLTGASFSKADIIWAIKVLRILECGYPFADNFPALSAWFERVRTRPAFRDGVMRSHRPMSLVFRAKAALENLFGVGIRRASRQAAV